jgi:purine nucleoside phosphorylase
VAAVGVITGSGLYSLPQLEEAQTERVDTAYGAVELTRGRLSDAEVLHLARHGTGHARLSSGVDHRANIAALAAVGAGCVVGCTICGSLEPALEPRTLVVFDELYFPSNRLPDGSLCTLFTEVGDVRRGHWIYDRPFADDVRRALLGAAASLAVGVRDGGCYGHVDGPRFNTRPEVRALAAAGVSAISQTAGPEAVLAGEAELPYALAGYVTDWANGVMPEPTAVEEVVANMERSSDVFAGLIAAAAARLAGAAVRPAGVMFRWEH